jgi:hypothetical protein
MHIPYHHACLIEDMHEDILYSSTCPEFRDFASDNFLLELLKLSMEV